MQTSVVRYEADEIVTSACMAYLTDALHDNRNNKKMSGIGHIKKVPGHKAPIASRKQPVAHRDGRKRENQGR
ncbi:hypothetical protein D3C80_1792510 [compost metagenome]